MKQALLCAATVLALGGCVATRGPVADAPVAAPLDTGAMAFILQRGSASITGQASVQQPDGKAVTAAGAEVELLPATPYTREVVKDMAAGQTQAQAAAGLRAYARVTRADANGGFQFFGLATGAYLVLLPFRLEATSDSAAPPVSAVLWREVQVPSGGKARIALSGRADGKPLRPAP